MSDNASIDLLAKISQHSDFYASICFTYSADLAFYEEAVLRPLRQNGCRRNLVFMDARRYADTTGSLKSSVNWVGRRYLLTPIDLENSQVFHPKMFLLLGSQRGRLLIGSGNITFTGFGHNHEVFTCLDWTPDTPQLQPVFSQAWKLVNEVSQRWSYSSEVRKLLQRIKYVADWLRAEEKSTEGIQLFHSLEESILDQCSELMNSESVEEITILSPFLDQKALALKKLYERFRPQKLHLLLQEGETVGNTDSLKALRKLDIPLEVSRFSDEKHYSHAKAYIFKASDKSYILTGSPNCTRSAWLASAKDGNLEVALLRKSDSQEHFDPLLEQRFSSQPVTSLDEIRLSQGSFPRATSHETIVRLLDVSKTGRSLTLGLRVFSSPENIEQFQLRISAKSQHFILIGELEPGKHKCKVSLSPDVQTELRYPSSVSIWGLTSEGQLLDLHCNELWINNVDEFRREVSCVLPVDARTGTYLAEIDLKSEEEWRDLYNSLIKLIELDVQGLKKRGGTYTASPSGKSRRSQKSAEEHETDVRLVLEEEEEGSEEIAKALFLESRMYAWLSYVRRGLPGAKPKEIEEGHAAGHKSPVRRQRPSKQVGQSFKNLVRKYIRSLRNEEYMQMASTHHILAYYPVFQRIVGLLFQHDTISYETLVKFTTKINQGFFGSPEASPPALDPRLNRHIRQIWFDEQVKQEITLYALVTALLSDLDLLEPSLEADGDDIKTRTWEQNLRVVSIILSLVDFDWIRDNINELARISSDVYNQDGDAFALRIINYIEHNFSNLDYILEHWIREVWIQIGNTDDIHIKDQLQQARMAYGFARYQALTELQKTDPKAESAQISLCKDLIHWMRGIDDVQIAKKWADILVGKLEAQGKSKQIAEAIFEEGRKLFYDGHHENSAGKLQEALQLAEQIGDEALVGKCETYLQHTKFFLE